MCECVMRMIDSCILSSCSDVDWGIRLETVSCSNKSGPLIHPWWPNKWLFQIVMLSLFQNSFGSPKRTERCSQSNSLLLLLHVNAVVVIWNQTDKKFELYHTPNVSTDCWCLWCTFDFWLKCFFNILWIIWTSLWVYLCLHVCRFSQRRRCESDVLRRRCELDVLQEKKSSKLLT